MRVKRLVCWVFGHVPYDDFPYFCRYCWKQLRDVPDGVFPEGAEQ